MPEMKNSGIEWIGEIPQSWDLQRLQFSLKEVNVKNNPIQTTQVLSLMKDRGVLPYEEKGDIGNKSKENVSEYHLAYPNTIVLNCMNILIGSVGISNYFGCVSPVYYVFKETEKSDLRFLNYIFNTREFQKELRKYAKGILEIRLRVSVDDILKRKIALPSKVEQTKIANFLDKKCSEIDSLYSDIEKQIETLEEYKKSVITKAVTKGLNSDVHFKSTNFEWIDSIPQHWEISKIKYLFNNAKGLPITKDNLIDEGTPVISYGQIHSKDNSGIDISPELLRFVDLSYQQLYPQCEVFKNDFIFADTSEDYNGCGNCVYKRDDSVLFAGYHSIILHSKLSQDNRYFAYLFKTDAWRRQIREIAYGVKVFSITQKTLINTYILVPSFEEQQVIANYLDDKCHDIDTAIANKKAQLKTLTEYKKSLIYEYVTGKKEVPENV